MSARIFLTQGIAAAVLAIGVIHSAGLAGVTASAGETRQHTVINADDKWDIPIPRGAQPPVPGDGNS
ncbi:hypothetical protein [Streptomyces sp. NPDC056492]|uniref:hypothetical protein n=1 Tax=unclassified Streptomyces TaxID=2593676 RepID=UPI0036C009AD